MKARKKRMQITVNMRATWLRGVMSPYPTAEKHDNTSDCERACHNAPTIQWADNSAWCLNGSDVLCA
jgi:hypothetical protein